MGTARLASTKAKFFIRKNRKTLFLLYIQCRIVFLILYTIIQMIGMFSENLILYRILYIVYHFIGFLILLKLVERVKNSLFTEYKLKIYMPGVFIISGIYAVTQTLNLFFGQNPYLQGSIQAILFLVNSILLPFYLFILISKQGTISNIFKNTGQLIQKKGIDFLKLLLLFVLLYIISAVVTRIPTLYINQWLLSIEVNLFLNNIITAGVETAASIIGIIPMYTEIKLYTAIFFLFSEKSE